MWSTSGSSARPLCELYLSEGSGCCIEQSSRYWDMFWSGFRCKWILTKPKKANGPTVVCFWPLIVQESLTLRVCVFSFTTWSYTFTSGSSFYLFEPLFSIWTAVLEELVRQCLAQGHIVDFCWGEKVFISCPLTFLHNHIGDRFSAQHF